MFTRRLTKFISVVAVATAVVAVAIAVGAGANGMVAAIPSSASSTPCAASPSAAMLAATPQATPTPAQVIPFTQGSPSAAKIVGEVPPDYSAGAGTIITGEAADKATAAALAAYPGGTVNRVVLLCSGYYNVHMIGVNWPHHVFVNANFQVIGAE
jgi:hypothetical protein